MDTFIFVTAALFFAFELWKMVNSKYIAYAQSYILSNKETWVGDYGDKESPNHDLAKTCVSLSTISLLYALWVLIILIMGMGILGLGMTALSIISYYLCKKLNPTLWSYVLVGDSILSMLLISYTVIYPMIAGYDMVRWF